MGAFSLMGILLFFGSDLLGELLATPPRDLASLVDPKTVLEQMAVKTDEDSLLALLIEGEPKPIGADELEKAAAELGAAGYAARRRATERLQAAGWAARPYLEKASESDDPEVRARALQLLGELQGREAAAADRDTDYVKRLMTMRLLEQMKSTKALPALERIAKGSDITLRDAALQAIALIKGQEVPRPSGTETLKQVAALVPDDAGFVMMMDTERGSRSVSLRHYFGVIMKLLADRPDMATMMPPLEQVLPQMEQQLAEVISMVGNIRVDSFTVVFSNELGDNSGYVALVFKGLWDPVRLGNTCKAGFARQREFQKHTVFYARHGPALCFVDEHTAVFSVGADEDGTHIDKTLAALASGKKAAPPAPAARALDLVIKKGMRAAAAGALSEPQKRELKAELAAEQERMQRRVGNPGQDVESAAFEVFINLADPDRFSAYLDDKGEVAIHAHCADEQTAKKLDESLSKLEKLLRETLIAQMRDAPRPMAELMRGIEGGAKLWENNVAGKDVILKLTSKLLSLSTLTMGVRVGSSRQRARVQIGEVVEALP